MFRLSISLIVLLAFAILAPAAAAQPVVPTKIVVENESTQAIVGICLMPKGTGKCADADAVRKNARHITIATGHSATVIVPKSGSCFYELVLIFANGVAAPDTGSLCGNGIVIQGDPHLPNMRGD